MPLDLRPFLAPALLCALLAGPVSPLAAQSTGSLHLEVHERVLDNGLTVLVWERPSAGRIGARVFYKVDIAAERPGTVGLTHMLEHYLFMGSELVGTTDWEAERPFAEAVERIEREITDERNRNRSCFLQREVFAELEVPCSTPRLDSLESALVEAFEAQHRFASGTDFDWIYQPAGGTGLTASTGRDWMKFDIDLPASRLELFMWMERSRVEHPVFRFFEPEREVVVDQIRRGDNRPDGPFQRVLRSMTYDAHPYGWAHWFSDLTRATREDHWEIFHRYFIPQNTVIVIVGEVEAEEVFRMAEAYWGSWEKGRPSPRLRTVEPEPVGEKRLEVEAAAGPSIVLHVPMPAVGHPDAPVFQVMAELLGGDRGLLERALIEETGLATSVGASEWLAKYPSHFTLRADARSNDDLEALEEAIGGVLGALARGEVAASELEGVADRMVLALARGLERIGPSAVQIGAMESIYGWRYLNEQPGLWAAVTPDDVARVAGRYFARSMRTVGVLRRVEGEAMTAAAEDERTVDLAFGGPPTRTARAPGAPLDRPVDARPLDVRPPAARPVASAADPLPIAEQPWWAPPWMSERRPSGFSAPPPVEDWRDLPAPDAPPLLPSPADHRVELGDGYRAFVVEDPLLPLVQMSALIDASTLHDPVGREGTAALTGTLLSRGGTGDLDPDQLEARLRELGASLSVQVNHGRTRVHLSTRPESAEAAARLLAEIVSSPAFLPDAAERERDRAAVSAGRALDDAQARARHLFHTTLYPPEHPLGRAPTEESVREITRDDLLAFHRARFSPERVVFAVSGRVDREAVRAALRSGLTTGSGAADLESAGSTPVARSRPVADGPRIVTAESDTRQGHIYLGHAGLDAIPEDHAALEAMNYILAGGSFVSRMMELLRVQTGITSALYGSVEPGPGIEFPYLWRFSGNPETLARGVRLAVEEIERIREEGVTEAELEGAVTSYIQGLIPSSYETAQRSAERLAERELLGRYLYQSPGYLNYYAGDEAQIEALRALTVEDVNAAARRYLRPDHLVIAVVGPLDEIRAGADGDDLRWVTEGR